jgi:hypothetical protein
MQQQRSIKTKHLHISPNRYSHQNSGTLVTPRTRIHILSPSRVDARTFSPRTSMIAIGSARYSEKLSSPWLQPRLTTLSSTGGGRNPKHENQQSTGLVHDRGCGYTYRLRLRIACTPVLNSEWHLAGGRPNEPILPCELSVVTVSSCIRASKRFHAKGIAPELWNAPVWPHGSRTQRSWFHSHLSPTNTLLSCWQVWFLTCWAQPGPNPTPGEVVCKKSPVKRLAHSILYRGELISSQHK